MSEFLKIELLQIVINGNYLINRYDGQFPTCFVIVLLFQMAGVALPVSCCGNNTTGLGMFYSFFVSSVCHTRCKCI